MANELRSKNNCFETTPRSYLERSIRWWKNQRRVSLVFIPYSSMVKFFYFNPEFQAFPVGKRKREGSSSKISFIITPNEGLMWAQFCLNNKLLIAGPPKGCKKPFGNNLYNWLFSDTDQFVVFFQLNVSLYGRRFNDSGSIICQISSSLSLLVWVTRSSIPKT